MKAMLLAAGLGTRLRPLTFSIPKPLLRAGEHSLLEWHINKLAESGIKDIVINIAYYKERVKQHFKNRKDINIIFSEEEIGRYETGGGIIKALPLLGAEPFIVISSDIWTTYDYKQLLDQKTTALGHIILVKKQTSYSKGDFGLIQDNVILDPPTYLFSGIGVYDPKLFIREPLTKCFLGSILKKAVAKKQITGELSQDVFVNVGTKKDLNLANEYCNKKN